MSSNGGWRGFRTMNELVGGMKNALERGASLDRIKQTFLNAGYKPEQIEEAASEVSQFSELISQNFQQYQQQDSSQQVQQQHPQKTQQSQQQDSSQPQAQPQKVQQFQPLPQIQKDSLIKKPANPIMIVLLILAGILTAIVVIFALFGKQILNLLL